MNIRAAVSKDGDARIVEVKEGFGEGVVITENLDGEVDEVYLTVKELEKILVFAKNKDSEEPKEEPIVCYDDSKCQNPEIECDDCLKYKILMSYRVMVEKKSEEE